MTYFNDNYLVPNDSKQFHDSQLIEPPQGFVDNYNALESKFVDLLNKNFHRHGIRQCPFLCWPKSKS